MLWMPLRLESSSNKLKETFEENSGACSIKKCGEKSKDIRKKNKLAGDIANITCIPQHMIGNENNVMDRAIGEVAREENAIEEELGHAKRKVGKFQLVDANVINSFMVGQLTA